MFRLAATLAGIMGILGLTLATVGVYGVVSFGAAQRTREMGIRMALERAFTIHDRIKEFPIHRAPPSRKRRRNLLLSSYDCKRQRAKTPFLAGNYRGDVDLDACLILD